MTDAVIPRVLEAIAAACGSAVARSRPVPGGSINAARRVDLEDGRTLFVKHREDPEPGHFAAEAAALRWLADAGALPVPRPVAVDEAWLALEWVDAGPRRADFDEALGRGLAALHAAGADRHGATAHDGPTDLGAVRVPNAAAGSAAAFYGEQRLLPLTRMAADRGALPAGAAARIEAVVARLGDLVPDEPPARLHGDLWSGNVMSGPDGGPLLVDPAAHGGHRESDLAMLRLFGAPGPRFLPAYEDAGPPLAAGWEDRIDLWQLQPLLVHAVLFGGTYGDSADRAARRYAEFRPAGEV